VNKLKLKLKLCILLQYMHVFIVQVEICNLITVVINPFLWLVVPFIALSLMNICSIQFYLASIIATRVTLGQVKLHKLYNIKHSIKLYYIITIQNLKKILSILTLHSVVQQSAHKTTTQNVIQNTSSRSRVNVHKTECMIMYRLWRMFNEVLYVSYKVKWQHKMKLNYFTEVSLFFNAFPQYTNAICLILAQFLYSFLMKVQLFTVSTAFLQCSQVLACTAKSAIKNLGTVRIACNTTEAVNFLDKHNCWQIFAFQFTCN
jgi:hypothetical protein